MAFQLSLTTILLFISTVVLLTVVFTAVRRRHVQGARSFIWLMLCVTEWTICYALGNSSTDPQMQIFWTKCQYIGIVMTPLALFIFSLEYGQMHSLITRRNLLLLAVIPSMIIILIWTNEYHHFIWSSIEIRQLDSGFYVDYIRGTGFWIHTAYSYILILTGSFILVYKSLKGPSIFETQGLMMIIGAAVPFLANIVYTFWLAPFATLDPTPFALMFSGVFYAWGLFRLGLFNLLPMAGEVVLEGLQDGVMVLDRSGHVLYINPAFAEYSGILGKNAIGLPAREVLARWPELVEEFRDTTQANTQITAQLAGDTTRHFEMRIFPLYDRGRHFGGRVFTLRESTDQPGTRAIDLSSATARSRLMLMTTKANGDIVEINDRLVGILGYTRKEIIEKSSLNLWESVEQRSTLLRKSRSEGFENMDINLLSKNGEKINMTASAKSLTVNNETYLFFAMRENR
jgi:PAS domain S-box-containing protein